MSESDATHDGVIHRVSADFFGEENPFQRVEHTFEVPNVVDLDEPDLVTDGGTAESDMGADQTRLTDSEQERWRELHEVPLEDLSDAETTSKIKLSIKRRFDYPEWVLMFEYGAPGSTGSVCDCLAVNTLPSRNFKLIGFEFKASRSDWLREKRDGQKNDYFVRMADEFYVVAPKGVVEESEIPDGWGYLELKPNSEQLYKLEDSELTEHQQGEPARRFWVRFLKQTVGNGTNYTQSDLQEAKSRGYQEAKDDGLAKRDLDNDLDTLRKRAESYERLQDRLGFLPWRKLDEDDAQTIEQAVDLVNSLEADHYGTLARDLSSLESDVERKAESMLEEIEDLKQGFGELQNRVKDGESQLTAQTGGGDNDPD